MTDWDRLAVTDAEISLKFSKYLGPKEYVWIPDAIQIIVSDESDAIAEPFCYTCLEHLLILLDHLDKREAGLVLGGTGFIKMLIEDEQVTLIQRTTLVGTFSQMKDLVRSLIRDVFEELDKEGLNTREIATDIKTGRFTLTIDPVAVHDSVTE